LENMGDCGGDKLRRKWRLSPRPHGSESLWWSNNGHLNLLLPCITCTNNPLHILQPKLVSDIPNEVPRLVLILKIMMFLILELK
jgi:hypothetical protein